MTLRTTLIALAIAATPALAYDSLEALMQDFSTQQAAAVKQYIADHPDAEDLESASTFLRQSLYMSEQFEELLALGLADYDKLAANAKEADPQEAASTISGVMQIYQELGRKEESREFLERAQKDFGGDEASEEMQGLFDHLAASFKQPDVGGSLELKFTAIDGREVDLAAMGGQVVLVDFWATWCGPCVREIPHVLEAYEKYHDQGFEIIGISLDDDRAKLDKFIADKEIPWPQYFDGQGWESELGRRYGIQSIPATFLVGPDGRIAAKDLRGDDLAEAVAKLLGDAASN
jgi:thiol-disulfide isomerase/thioredoxin